MCQALFPAWGAQRHAKRVKEIPTHHEEGLKKKKKV